MTITVDEKPESRSTVVGQSHERIYLIRGTDDQAQAAAALLLETPAEVDGLALTTAKTDPISIDEDHPDACLWLGVASYSQRSTTTITLGDIIIQGTTGGGTQTQRVSVAPSTGYAPPGKVAPNFDDAINVNGDTADGVEIGLRQFEFTVTKVFPSTAYPDLADIYPRCWTWNDVQVIYTDSETGLTLILEMGECLFKGVDFGRARGDGGIEFVYHMAASPNQAPIAVGGNIVVANKLGWEYLWLFFAKKEDAIAKMVVTVPTAAYVAPVYYPSDHSFLGI